MAGPQVLDLSPGGSQPEGGRGLLDFVKKYNPITLQKNLLEDVVDAGLGFFPGLYQAARHPIAAAENIAKTEWQQWSPLFTGHPLEFAKQTFEHPLGPILDVAAIFTGGASLAGKSARLLSDATYTTKAAGALGERTIARAASRPGAFQARIETPSIVDRLAATTRNPPELMRVDRPGAPGRLPTFKALEGTRLEAQANVARQAIPKSTSRNAATQWAQVGLHGLSEQLASKGGRYQLPAQLSYEQAQLVRLAGNAAALGWQHGQLKRFADAMEQAGTNPQMRSTLLRDFFVGNWENLKRHADKDGQLVPLADWESGKFNKLSYCMHAQKKYFLQKGKREKALYTGTREELLQNFKDFGRYASTPDIKKADIEMVNGVPHVRLVNRQTAKNLGIEAKNSANAALKAYYKGTNLWKVVLLGLSPRFLVNNAIGNALLLGAETMGSHAAVGMFEAMKQARGLKWAEQQLAEGIKSTGWHPNDSNHWINRWHADQMGQAFHSTAFKEADKVGMAEDLLGAAQQGRPLGKLTDKSFNFVGEVTERRLRVAALYAKATSEPLVKEAIKKNKKKGMPDAVAVDKAIEEVYRRHPEVQRRVTDEVYSTMGNYVAMHGWERNLRSISPFYTWQRHIMLNSTRMALKHPGRTLVAADLGHQGSSWVQDTLGKSTPDWMRSFLPLGEGNPRIPVLSTSGMNPWASGAENALMIESLMPGGDTPRAGETVGTSLNPFVQSGIEQLTGTSMLTGQPLATKDDFLSKFIGSTGPIGGTVLGPVQNLPQVRLGVDTLDPQQSPQTIFAKSPEESLLAWLGLPIKWLNQTAAQTLGRQQ